MLKKKRASSGSFKNVIYKITNHMYVIYMYEEDLTLNNLQWLICNKTWPSQSIKTFALFWYMLVCSAYIMWPNQFKVHTVVGSIVVVGVLACCEMFLSMCDLKAAQMNMQCSLIWELMLYEFEQGYNATYEHYWVCPIPQKYIGHYCEGVKIY